MKISALLREAPGTPTLSLDQDLMQRAKLKFPGYDSQQALSLYIADQAVQQQKTDAAQNNLINKQQSALKTIGQELQDYETQAQETDREVERLKQLSGTLTAGSSDRQQKAKVSADELEKLQKDLEKLKSKPGMDPEKYKEIEQQITKLANSKGAEDSDVKKLQNVVNNTLKQANVNLDNVTDALNKANKEIDRKEKAFDRSLRRNAEKFEKNTSRYTEYDKKFQNYEKDFKQAADTVAGYKKEINNLGSELSDIQNEKNAIQAVRTNIEKDAKDINDIKNDMRQSFKFINQYVAKLSSSQPIKTTKSIPTIDWLAGGNKKPQPTVGEPYVQESITEDSRIVPAQQYRNKYYNEWIIKHLPGLFSLFKRKFNKELKEKGYSDKQVAHILEEFVPILYDLGDEKTPLTPQQVALWMDNVAIELRDTRPDSPAKINQLELFSESLDRILQLSSIKKG
jgi:chromosome segregation ATPase